MAAPPRHYSDFVARYPDLGRAWQQARTEEERGPLDPRAQRLVKLGIAIATGQQGATHSAARKALAAGLEPEALYQVVALAATIIGFPAAVAAFGWVRDVLEEPPAKPAKPATPAPRGR